MLGFFKIRKHESRTFNYKPRFYDAEKQELQHRIKAAENLNQHEAANRETAKTRIKTELRRARTSSRRGYKGLWKGSTFRMLLILVGLITLLLYALNQWLPSLLKLWYPDTL